MGRMACLCLKSYRTVAALAADLFGKEVPAGGGGGIWKVEANLAKVRCRSLYSGCRKACSELPALRFLSLQSALYLPQILILQKAVFLCVL